MEAYFDTGSLIVIIATFVLFIMALFAKGFTHDIIFFMFVKIHSL